MRSIIRQCLFGAVVLVILHAAAHAHDPGLSYLDLVSENGALVANVTFARTDLDPLAANVGWEALTPKVIELRAGTNLLTPTESSVQLTESDAVQFRYLFPAPPGDSDVSLRSELLKELPRGHRQFVSVKNDRGAAIEERILDAGNHEIVMARSVLSQITQQTATNQSASSHSFRDFFILGIEHIWTGYDHLCFLFGLLIVGGRFMSSVKVITSFTVAHSLTLALATFHLVNLPARIVEPLIAASIVYVGLENLFRRDLNNRWILTFVFGLVHGLGFASVLRDLGVGVEGGTGAAVPLVSFNLGVEFGQIAIASVVMPLIWWLQKRPAFATRYVPACSIAVALMGGYWLLQRTVFP